VSFSPILTNAQEPILDLNEWLERFVARHATQMQDVTTGVAKLSRSMGIHVATSDAPTGGDGPATHASLHAPMHEILSEVQRGIVALQQRANNEDDVNRALLTLVHNAGVHVDRLANERQSMSTYCIISLTVALTDKSNPSSRGIYGSASTTTL